MKKLSEYEGDEALDLLAELIEPATRIMADSNLASKLRNRDVIGAVRLAIKEHKEEVKEIAALLNGEDPDTFKPKLLTLPVMLSEIFNDPELANLFSSQSQSGEDVHSGSASGNTGA